MNRASPHQSHHPHQHKQHPSSTLPPISRTSSSSSQPRTNHRREPPRMNEPVTPTPKKASRRRGVPRSQQRVEQAEQEQEEEQKEHGEYGGGDEELFDLLGVASPPPQSVKKGKGQAEGLSGIEREKQPQGVTPRRGMLAVSRADIEASTSSPLSTKQTKKRNPSQADRAAPVVQYDNTSQSETEPVRSTPQAKFKSQTKSARSRASKPPTIPDPTVSNLSAQLAAHDDPNDSNAIPNDTRLTSIPLSTAPSSDSMFDTSTLSQSLPSTFFAPQPLHPSSTDMAVLPGEGKKKGKGKKKAQAQAQGQKENDPSASFASVVPDAGTGHAQGQSQGKGTRKGQGTDNIVDGVWDMPGDAGPSDGQVMTWQQKLGSYPHADSPSRSNSINRKTTTTTANTHNTNTNTNSNPPSSFNPKFANVPFPGPSPLNPNINPSANANTTPRPAHARRRSADASFFSSTSTSQAHAHSQSPATPATPAHQRNSSAITKQHHQAQTQSQNLTPSSSLSYVPSLMDTLPPFNPAVNATRAPQTPAKHGLAHHFATQPLPLLKGEFPRIGGAGGGGAGGGVIMQGGGGAGGGGGVIGEGKGPKYAGASFHNSPAGSSLPKPDLDDF